MKNYYKNSTTEAITNDREIAKIWYNLGDEIEVWYFSEALQEWICGMVWCQ